MAAMHAPMEVLSSRVILRPSDPARSRRFYRDTLGLAVYREFGPADSPGTVFFLGGGFLEVSGHSDGGPTAPGSQQVAIWLQVRDLTAEHQRLVAAGAYVVREPRVEPWGLREMWVEDPDGVRLVMVEVPDDHPLRRDQRALQP
jgi:predicted enzyme related to lactoylglutathione lyase